MPYQNEDVVESKERMQLIIASGVRREIVGGTINERRPRSQQIRSDACRAHQDRKDKSKPGPVASPACYTRRDRAGGSRRSRRWCRRPGTRASTVGSFKNRLDRGGKEEQKGWRGDGEKATRLRLGESAAAGGSRRAIPAH